MERVQSQQLPGKGRTRAKFRKKRGVWVGKVFRFCHLASQQTLSAPGQSPKRTLRVSVQGSSLKQRQRETGPVTYSKGRKKLCKDNSRLVQFPTFFFFFFFAIVDYVPAV